jgi:hypothetical protein
MIASIVARLAENKSIGEWPLEGVADKDTKRPFMARFWVSERIANACTD